MRTLIRRILAVPLVLAGGALLYFGGWLVAAGVLPQVRETGWSLRETNLILNREWVGNELYALIAIYWIVGVAFLFAAYVLWRAKPAPSAPERHRSRA